MDWGVGGVGGVKKPTGLFLPPGEDLDGGRNGPLPGSSNSLSWRLILKQIIWSYLPFAIQEGQLSVSGEKRT